MKTRPRKILLSSLVVILCLTGVRSSPDSFAASRPAHARTVRPQGDPVIPVPDWTAEGTADGEYFAWVVGGVGDLDGDGYADAAVGAPGYPGDPSVPGSVHVYRGGGDLEMTEVWVLADGLPGSHFGQSVSHADVNGDGFSDLIVGAPETSSGQDREGAAYLYLGSTDGLTASPSWSVEGSQVLGRTGTAVAGAGDVNHDGYEDVLVASDPWLEEYVPAGSSVSLYLGSSTGLSPNPAWSASTGLQTDLFGFSMAAAGDVNGDGYSDVIIGAPEGTYDWLPHVYIYHGTPSGLSASPARILEHEQPGSSFGRSVSSAGDVNGDGFDDVVIGAPFSDGLFSQVGRVYVYFGSPAGLAASPAWFADGQFRDRYHPDYLGHAVATVGDLNGDGFSDIIASAPGYDARSGGVLLYPGSSTGPTAQARWIAEGGIDSSFGWTAGGAGDVNGDGYGDVIVGTPWAGLGQVSVFHLDPDSYSDVDGDGFLDGADNCPKLDNSDQSDVDVDGTGDVCDLCPTAMDPTQDDGDQDGIGDQCDNCYWPPNTDQQDADGDGVGDACDNCPTEANPRQENSDHEGYPPIGDACEADDDGDAILDDGDGTGIAGDHPCHDGANTGCDDNCRTVQNPGQEDENDDGVGTVCERILQESQTLTGGHAPPEGFAWSAYGGALGSADVDGDGFADLIVGESGFTSGQYEEGRALLFPGSTSGLSQIPVWEIEGNETIAFLASSVDSAGDVNGDGFQDVVVGAAYGLNGSSLAVGSASLYLGGPGGLSVTPAWTVRGQQAYEFLGFRVIGAGDLNGDGYDDVAVSTYRCDGPTCGFIYVYLGEASGLPQAPSVVLSQPSTSGFGERTAAAGDVNGDGFDDLITGQASYCTDCPSGSNYTGRALLFLGSAGGPSTSPSWTFLGPDRSDLGASVSSAGDVNGDGFDDVLVGAPSFDFTPMEDQNYANGKAYLFRGGAQGLSATPAWVVTGSRRGQFVGFNVASAGDFNGDGYGDVALVDFISTPDNIINKGRVSVYLGSSAGLRLSPAWAAMDDQDRNYFGSALTAADLDGDGLDDLIGGAGSSSEPLLGMGRVFVYAGRPDPDPDADGVPFTQDNCPAVSNPAQADQDADGVGDACDDCLLVVDPVQTDSDGDSRGDACDNCPFYQNSDQYDRDNDSQGDACDLDDGEIYIHPLDANIVDWLPEAGAEAFNVYRGDLSVLRQTGQYTQDIAAVPLARRFCDLTDSLVLDYFYDPPAGKAVFYLVTGIAGGIEGSLGTDSAGVPRPNAHPCH